MLAQRVAAILQPALGPDRARSQAISFLGDIEESVDAHTYGPLRDTLERTADRWHAAGVGPAAVHRALFATLLPDELDVAVRAGDDMWAELAATLGPMLESVPMAAFVVDLDQRLRFWNEAFERQAGLAAASHRGRRLVELLDDRSRDWPARQLHVETALRSRSQFGRVRFVWSPEHESFLTALLMVRDGAPMCWLLTVSPEAERALSDPSLAERLERESTQKAQFAALLAVSNAVVGSLDLDTILNTIARQVREVIQVDECTVFVYDEAEQLLRPAAADVESYQDEVMQVRLKLGQGITGHVAQTGVGEIVNDAQDDPRSVQVPGTPVEPSSLLCVPLFVRGRIAGVITLTRSGTGRGFQPQDLELATLFAGQCSAAIANARAYEEQRKAYEELRETQTQLVQSAKLNALGEMAGGVAHDFNNILAAILGRTQLLLQAVSDDEMRSQLEVIEQAALDGASTVRRVQEFTRVRNDERFETVDVNQVLTGVLELTRPVWEAGAKRTGVSIDVKAELAARQSIAGNASELREVFTNLVLNAVDAMPDGGTILVSSHDADDLVKVRVRDTGMGMDEETRARVFDPFFTTKAVKGTGLGLSVAYGIVTRHRGEIRVASEAGMGTEFVLSFPAGRAVAPAGSVAGRGPRPALRVLAVDDEEPVLEVLADLLRALGQDVVGALGGPQGLEAFESGGFDVVFSDLGMPEVNGWDLALHVKSRSPSTAIVLVTGWGYQLEEGTAQAHGVDVILPKPFSIEDLDRVLRQLGGSSAREAAAA